MKKMASRFGGLKVNMLKKQALSPSLLDNMIFFVYGDESRDFLTVEISVNC
jgi:hypothetical protein